MRKTALLLPLLVWLAACQSEEAPRTTWLAELYVRYLVPESQVKAEATFMAGDSLATARPLALGGDVRFNGHAMGRRQVADKLIRYNYENVGPQPDTVGFAWPHPFRGHRLELHHPMPRIDSFRLSANDTLLQLTLQPPLQADEQVVVMLLDSLQRATSRTAIGPQPDTFSLTPPDPDNTGMPQATSLHYYLVRKRLRLQQVEDGRITLILETYSELKDL